MKISSILSGLLIILFFSACIKDQEGSLTVHFKAVYAGQTLQTFVTKPFTSPQQLQFSNLSFYVSDFNLLDQSNAQSLGDIALVDLSFNDMSSADAGYTFHFDKLPAKTYSGIQFGIGVPPDMNAKKPEDFSSSHPLSNPTNYWQTWSSYIFMKTEGHIDTLGTGSYDLGFAYHTGTDKLFRVFTAPVNISIENGKNKEISILVDYQKVLEGIDIKSNPLNSSPNDTTQINMIVQNLQNALTLVQ